MSKKILLSLAALAVIAIAGTYGTIAFFSDKEASTGNQFVAGSVDLIVTDENATYNGNTVLAWDEGTVGKFFDFNDLKPGDFGYDMAKLRIETNEAYVCANIDIKEFGENVCNNVETKIPDPSCGTGNDQGELQNFVKMKIWLDATCQGNTSGDPIFDGALSSLELGSHVYSLGKIAGNTNYCIVKKWCFGNWTTDQAGALICDGSGDQNISQTDTIKGDIMFYAVQTRHNDKFACADVNWNPTAPQ